MIEALNRITGIFSAIRLKPICFQLNTEAYVEFLRETPLYLIHLSHADGVKKIMFSSVEVKEYVKNEHKIEIIYSDQQGKERKVVGNDLSTLYERLIIQLAHNRNFDFVGELDREAS